MARTDASRLLTACAAQIAAQTFIRENEYGLAVSYYTSAEDWAGLGRVIDLVLEGYIAQGMLRTCISGPLRSIADRRRRRVWPGPVNFALLVAKIAPSLHNIRVDSGSTLRAPAVFLHRLKFAVRFAEFHQRRANGDGQGAAADVTSMFREGIVPKAWWAVILCDAVDLLQYGASVPLCCAADPALGA